VRGRIEEGDLVIAADGGARLALAADVVPHLLVGDEDSLSQAEVAALPATTLRWTHAVDKDWSDLELALHAAMGARVAAIDVLGAFGGRLDHLLVNLGLLHLAWGRASMRLLSARGEAFLLHGEEIRDDWSVDRIVTLVPLTPEVVDVTLVGFAFPLSGEILRWGSSRGLSNRVCSRPVRLAAGAGRLLVVAGPRQVEVEVHRTWLEMRAPDESKLGFLPGLRVERVEECSPAFYRWLYAEVGRDYHWVDRRGWSDVRIAAHLRDPRVSVWAMYERGAPAGWFELRREVDDIELAYFGLLPGRGGRGLGRHLLSCAIREAFAMGCVRLFVNTCSLDDPLALPNYRRRGFEPYREETYVVEQAFDA
jgi:thiamine pyrophosphokinase